jgi:formylglycine-generating enzyme required for sulfatase activity
MEEPDDVHFREEAALSRYGGLGDEFAALAGCAVLDLVTIVEDVAAGLPVRLAAGAMLGILGDPRAGPVPAVCLVAGGRVPIGLRPEMVAPVAEQWAHMGVKPEWLWKEVPEHEVVLRDFWIGRYQVTNSQYLLFLLSTGYPERPSTWYLGAYPWFLANHPVAGVSPAAADRYTRWLTAHTGHPWRLPSEAEWEHAAKGPGGWEYPWGMKFDPECANTRETGVHTTTPVGMFPAGSASCGALDMAGNVEEFVSDDYAPYPGGRVVVDHLVTELGRYRVTRGGSFARFGDLARTRRRHGPLPRPLYPAGFRVATHEDPTDLGVVTGASTGRAAAVDGEG